MPHPAQNQPTTNAAQALGYIYREILTALFIAGALWPASYGLTFLRQHLALAAAWVFSCLSMSTFTLLNALKVEDVSLMYVSLPSTHWQDCQVSRYLGSNGWLLTIDFFPACLEER